jgi:hypothetical protein
MSAIELTAAQEELLRSQVIDATRPGAVLHDFQLILDYIGEKGVKAGGKYNLLPIQAVIDLDDKLAHPLNLPLQRPQLKSHPYMQGLHLLLRASTLGRIEGMGEKARLVIDLATLASWNALNPTEQYFSLLEAWLLAAQPAMVGMRGDWEPNLLQMWSYSLAHLEPGKTAETRRLLDALFCYRFDETYNTALANLFGLVTTNLTGGTFQALVNLKVAITPFGEALLLVLGRYLQEQWEQEESEGEEEEGEFDLRPLFQPYFPAYQNTLSVGELPPAREGVFVFKVSLGKVWRQIALKHDHTLHDLLLAILKSVEFDYDHLYAFTYRDELGRTVRAESPEYDEGLSADTVELGMLPLQPGQSMSLVYDFGDNWRFNVKLERVDPPGSMKKLPKVIESHGKAPEQYPSWD